MKISKDALRSARQLFRACIDSSGRLHTSTRVKRVIKRLSEEKPRDYLAILSAFQRFLRLELEKRSAIVESVSRLSNETREQLRIDLQRKYGDDLTLEFYENPALIGGLRVKVGSHVWDGSVSAKLEALRQSLA